MSATTITELTSHSDPIAATRMYLVALYRALDEATEPADVAGLALSIDEQQKDLIASLEAQLEERVPTVSSGHEETAPEQTSPSHTSRKTIDFLCDQILVQEKRIEVQTANLSAKDQTISYLREIERLQSSEIKFADSERGRHQLELTKVSEDRDAALGTGYEILAASMNDKNDAERGMKSAVEHLRTAKLELANKDVEIAMLQAALRKQQEAVAGGLGFRQWLGYA